MNTVHLPIGPRPVGVDPAAVPVAVFLAGAWQIVWVTDPDDYVAAMYDLGYHVTSDLAEPILPVFDAPERPRLVLVK